MRIIRYGITLSRLTEDRIETVRKWRNEPSIRNFMEFREYITPQMQLKWFRSLVPLNDFYFIIEYHNEPVGLIHTAHIDWEKKTGDAGLFIRKDELLGTHVPVLASLSMVDFFFSFCNLETITAKVMEENQVAIKYNMSLGFKPTEIVTGEHFRRYVLTRDDYFATTPRLHAMTKAMHDNKNVVEMNSVFFEKLQAINAVNADRALQVAHFV